MKTVALKIEGMSCGGCVGRVRGAIGKVGGATALEVAVGSARVEFDEAMTSRAALVRAIEKLGFEVHADEAGAAL